MRAGETSADIRLEMRSWCDRITGWLLCGMVLFSPWAFGTTQNWSIKVMNLGGYTLGAFAALRLVAGSNGPQRWNVWRVTMAVFSVLLLGFVATSALNASATYLPRECRLEEHAYTSWLPHSYDAPATRKSFGNYLALACVFWATHNWLIAGSERSLETRRVPRIPRRLRILLWVVSINAAVLALEGIIQRSTGTANLLGFMPTHDNKDALSQFGPFAYRSNAAQYLNLVWPVTLGFWWWLQRSAQERGGRRNLRHVLLPCVMIMAAGSVYSNSRAGAGVAGAMLVSSCALLASRRNVSWGMRGPAIAAGVVTLAAGFFISWGPLSKRLADTSINPMAGRDETYQLAEQMARDYPWFGTGPGTFRNLFQIYRNNPEQYWPAQLHNDWMEMRITFGRIGFALMLAALAMASLRWILPGGEPRDGTFLLLTTLALTGCLAHARFDFPFQIYSIEFIFILLTAILFTSSRASRGSSRASAASS